MNTVDFLIIFLAFAMGGVLKGATGAGAPIVVIPLLTMYNGVVFAVTVFVIPNLVSNVVQLIKFRKHLGPRHFVSLFTGAGATGAAIGTVMLTTLSSGALMAMVAAAVFLYIAFRLYKPDWRLELTTATQLALPAGLIAGILQGSSGVSAPISITFLNAMKLERIHFIANISLLFFSMGLLQFSVLTAMGRLDVQIWTYSLMAIIPLVGAMPIGSKLIQHVSKELFDRIILGLLFVLAAKIVFDIF